MHLSRRSLRENQVFFFFLLKVLHLFAMNVCMGVLYMGEGLEGLGTNRSLGGPPKSFTLQLQLSFRFFIEKECKEGWSCFRADFSTEDLRLAKFQALPTFQSPCLILGNQKISKCQYLKWDGSNYHFGSMSTSGNILYCSPKSFITFYSSVLLILRLDEGQRQS